MGTREPDSIWLTCPKCNSRIEVRPTATDPHVRCNHCGRGYVVAGLGVSAKPPVLTEAAPKQKGQPLEPAAVKVTDAAEEDEIRLAAADEEIHVAPPQVLTAFVPAVNLPSAAEDPPVPEAYVEPPRQPTIAWAFFSGTFDFVFWPNAVTKWLLLSLIVVIGEEISLLTQIGLSYFSAIIVIASFVACTLLAIYVLSYAAASLVSIVENTVYSMDKASDWPEGGVAERFSYLLRLAYVEFLVALVAAPVAWLVSLYTDEYYLPFAGVALIVFPIVLLSTMETDSLSPFSKPIGRSLTRSWYVWLAFYLVSGAVWAGWLIASMAALKHLSPNVAAMIPGPLWAACVLIYARLLGRLAFMLLLAADSDEDQPSRRERAAARRRRRIVEIN